MLTALLRDVVPYLRARRAAAASELLVRDAIDPVWNRVAAQIVQMSEAEALGYTRAHAVGVIEAAAEPLFAEMQLGARTRVEALRDATQRIARTVWERACTAKVAPQRRRAA